jgi:hypothetical protein
MSHRMLVALFVGLIATPVLADGMVKAPVTYKSKPYHGSLEETAQEAILIFHPGDGKQSATQDMILKISVEGEVDQFGWVVPLPNAPTATAKEDAKLFKELHQYVEKRLASRPRVPLAAEDGAKNAADEAPAQRVEVIERKVVGSFDVAIVREKQAGALNDWLKKEGFATVTEGKEIVEAYRKEGYVFACMKVSNAALAKGKAIDSAPAALLVRDRRARWHLLPHAVDRPADQQVRRQPLHLLRQVGQPEPEQVRLRPPRLQAQVA